MNVASKLTFPALLGGFIALLASGAFAPPVYGQPMLADTVVQLNHADGAAELRLRDAPDADARTITTLRASAWAWLDRCTSDRNDTEWCLIERGDTRGWVRSSHLHAYWE